MEKIEVNLEEAVLLESSSDSEVALTQSENNGIARARRETFPSG